MKRPPNTREIILALSAAIDSAGLWLELPDPGLRQRGARAKQGVGHGWTIIVVDYPGGADGAATRIEDGLVVHLTPELAVRARELAWP